jgi:hypothetical protein
VSILSKSFLKNLLLAAVVLFALSPFPSRALALKDGYYKPGKKLIIGGRRMRCGKTNVLIDSNYWAVAGSVPGLIGINPKKLRRYSRVEQWFIFTHECGHQHKGKSERKADCWAARTGHRQGWLKKSGLRRICRTLRNDPARGRYPSGKNRCKIMRRCY